MIKHTLYHSMLFIICFCFHRAKRLLMFKKSKCHYHFLCTNVAKSTNNMTYYYLIFYNIRIKAGWIIKHECYHEQYMLGAYFFKCHFASWNEYMFILMIYMDIHKRVNVLSIIANNFDAVALKLLLHSLLGNEKWHLYGLICDIWNVFRI